MRKRTWLATLLAVAGCGDNRPSNFPPVLSQQEINITMSEDDTVTIDATAHDPEERKISYSASSPGHGTLAGGGPTYTYTPAANFVGSDELTITVEDDDNTLEVPVHITVVASDDAPVAEAQQVSVDRNSAKAITLVGTDVDSEDLLYEIMSEPQHGTLAGDPPDVVYTPDPGYFGADAFSFRVSDTFVASAAATVSLTVVAVPACGDGLQEGSEACDDGNLVNDDGCSNLCAAPSCGDGVTQLALGEQCDDGNSVASDGCDAQCQVEAFAPRNPVLVSGLLQCTTSHPAKGNHVAVDVSGNIYAIFKCNQAASFVVSRDRGITYSAPLDLTDGITGLTAEVAVAAGGTGLVYATILQDNGDLYLRISQDRGDTWSTALRIGSAASPIVSLSAFNDHLYVAFARGDGIDVFRSATRGGTFDLSHAVLEVNAFNALYDPSMAPAGVITAGDQGSFRLRSSADGGGTWGTEQTPPGTQFNSSWASGNGQLFVSGTNLGALGNASSLYVISASDFTSSPIPGLPVITTNDNRTVAADFVGGAYVASELDSGGVQLDRLAAGATALEPPISVSATGSAPGVAALPGGQGAVVVFTEPSTNSVHVGVYPNAIP